MSYGTCMKCGSNTARAYEEGRAAGLREGKIAAKTTLRDQFAGHAMSGLLADSSVARGKNGWPADRDEFNEMLAISAYHKADAMLDIREAKK